MSLGERIKREQAQQEAINKHLERGAEYLDVVCRDIKDHLQGTTGAYTCSMDTLVHKLRLAQLHLETALRHLENADDTNRGAK